MFDCQSLYYANLPRLDLFAVYEMVPSLAFISGRSSNAFFSHLEQPGCCFLQIEVFLNRIEKVLSLSLNRDPRSWRKSTMAG